MPTVRRCQVVPKTGTTSLTPPGRTKAKPSPTSRNMESAKINRPGLTKRGGWQEPVAFFITQGLGGKRQANPLAIKNINRLGTGEDNCKAVPGATKLAEMPKKDKTSLTTKKPGE